MEGTNSFDEFPIFYVRRGTERKEFSLRPLMNLFRGTTIGTLEIFEHLLIFLVVIGMLRESMPQRIWFLIMTNLS